MKFICLTALNSQTFNIADYIKIKKLECRIQKEKVLFYSIDDIVTIFINQVIERIENFFVVSSIRLISNTEDCLLKSSLSFSTKIILSTFWQMGMLNALQPKQNF